MRVLKKMIDCSIYHFFDKENNVLHRIVTDADKSQEEIQKLVALKQDESLEYFLHGHISSELINGEEKIEFLIMDRFSMYAVGFTSEKNLSFRRLIVVKEDANVVREAKSIYPGLKDITKIECYDYFFENLALKLFYS
ncbi:hypothetical protein [Enterococcus faecalis]|uniref:hypothetical protein n=1 Tax=Enterococcus faecalis TaxID=1351 RepID=UPI002477D0F5|nr:hypothetical protein [Enterococcus faecalis]